MSHAGKIGVVLWSIALPGFGQLINRKFLKGFVLIGLEFLINVRARLNEVIMLSFNGKIEQAIAQADYEWLLFYPCVYMFAMWDAYRDATDVPFTTRGTLPYVFGAYFGTIGVMYSPTVKIMGVLLGPVWLGIVGLIVGLAISMLFRSRLRPM